MDTHGISLDTAQAIGHAIGIDFAQIDIEQFRMGIAVEQEHGSHDPQTNVIGDSLELAGKIAWAHLKELPDYYSRLSKMESEAETTDTTTH